MNFNKKYSNNFNISFINSNEQIISQTVVIYIINYN